MALLYVEQHPVELAQTGIALTLVPAVDAATNQPSPYPVEVWRAPDSAGTPDTVNALVVAVLPALPPGGGVFVDPLPLTPSRYHYRHRHVQGAGTGDFSEWVGPVEAVELHGDLSSALRTGQGGTVLTNVSRQSQLDGQNRTLLQALTYEIPNAEFDVWENTSQPHAWSVNVTGGSAAAKETLAANIFSGDFAAKYTFAGGLAGDYQGFTTNDPIVGAFCCPLRPGASYRIKFAAKASGGAAPKVRLRFTHDAGATLVNDVSADLITTYTLCDGTITIPAAAERRSRLAIEFTRGDTTTRDFWIDSLRVVEDTPSIATAATRLADVASNLVINGGFEEGAAFWRADPATGGTFEVGPTPPSFFALIEGAQSLYWTGASGITGRRLQQCDRGSDADSSQAGQPLYIAVEPFDEIWGIAKLNLSALSPAAYACVIEEYSSTKAFIQRTTLASTTAGGTSTLIGGAVLSSTTRYIVVGFSWPGHASGGAFVSIDAVKLFRVLARRRCLAFKSAAVQSLNNTTETAISFDAESYDIGGLHDTAANTTKISVTAEMLGRGGVRLVGQISFAANATGSRRARWKKNGSTFLAEQRVPAIATAAIPTVVQCVARDDRPALADFYELYGQQDSGGALNVVNGTREVTFGEAIHDY